MFTFVRWTHCVLFFTAALAAAEPTPKPAAEAAPKLPPPFPFVLPWDDSTPSATNMASWLEAPAGKRGFIAAKGGRLFAGDKRVRLFGVNFSFGANFPEHDDADKIAARLAKFGIGCVRLHHMDTKPAPDGLLQADMITIDPAQLEKLDYFVAALKKLGIYVDINLHVGRVYPGLATWEGMPRYFKGVDNFFPRMIEMQRDYARALLTHVNPYTKTAYVSEPAVAFIEINNENALSNEWWNGTLDDMPPPYKDELGKQWNQWLLAKYKTDDKIREAWNAAQEELGTELLNDPKWGKWTVQRNGNASLKAEALIGPSDLPGNLIRVETAGAEAAHGRFVCYHLPLDSSKVYTFSFYAKSDKPRVVTIAARQTSGLYRESVNIRVSIATEWQPYTVAFTPSRSIGEAEFGFTQLAGETGELHLAGLSLRTGGTLGMRDHEKLGGVDLLAKRQFQGRTPEVQRDWIAFLLETETRYWTGMARYLKETLQARSLVIGTQMGYSPFPIQSKLDVVDVHGYWQHPRFPRKPWDPGDWQIKNTSLVNAAEGGIIGSMAAMRPAGKPYICTEFNASAPNTYSSEAFLLLSAYAALQDWDAIFAYSYSHEIPTMKSGMISGFFDIAQHPAKMATLPAACALFIRGDVRSAETQTVAASPEQVLEQIRKSGPATSATRYQTPQQQALRHPVQLALGGASAPGAPPARSVYPGITSDNMDLRWTQEAEKNVVTIDTPRSAGIIGFAVDTAFPLSQISITPHATMQGWSTVNATVLDGQDFKSAKRILVTATGYAANTDMRWKDPEKTSVGNNWGKAPSVVEGVAATIVLPCGPGSKAWALDERGQRKTEVPLEIAEGKSTLRIGPEWKTLWYEVEAPSR